MVREEDIKSFAGKIHSETTRMAILVEDIINLTKLDNGDTEMQWETVICIILPKTPLTDWNLQPLF